LRNELIYEGVPEIHWTYAKRIPPAARALT
jgi:hypothetical protein